MILRVFETAKDYPTLCQWWSLHGVPSIPAVVLPVHGVIVRAGEDVAMGFCYFDTGNRIGCVDFITTNPTLADGPTKLEAIAHILKFFEKVANDRGCHNLFSFVSKDTGLHRYMVKQGWQDPQASPHVYLLKKVA